MLFDLALVAAVSGAAAAGDACPLADAVFDDDEDAGLVLAASVAGSRLVEDAESRRVLFTFTGPVVWALLVAAQALSTLALEELFLLLAAVVG